MVFETIVTGQSNITALLYALLIYSMKYKSSNFGKPLTLSLLAGIRVEERGRQLPADRFRQLASCQPVDRQKFLHRRLRVLSHAFEGFPLFNFDFAIDVVAPLIFELIVQARRFRVQHAAPASLRWIGVWAPRLEGRYPRTARVK